MKSRKLMAITPSNVRRTTNGFRVLALVAALSVVFLSFSPTEKRAFHTRGAHHLVVHVAAFGSLTALAFAGADTKRLLVGIVTSALLLGLALEVGEHAIFGTPLETADIVMDFFGVLIGVCAGAIMRKAFSLGSGAQVN